MDLDGLWWGGVREGVEVLGRSCGTWAWQITYVSSPRIWMDIDCLEPRRRLDLRHVILEVRCYGEQGCLEKHRSNLCMIRPCGLDVPNIKYTVEFTTWQSSLEELKN